MLERSQSTTACYFRCLFSWLFAASMTTFPMIIFALARIKLVTLQLHDSFSHTLLYPCFSVHFQLNAACLAECCKQNIFPKMSKYVCSLAKAHNKNWRSESRICLWDNEDTPSPCERVQWHAAPLRLKANLSIKHFQPSQLKQQQHCLQPA